MLECLALDFAEHAAEIAKLAKKLSDFDSAIKLADLDASERRGDLHGRHR